MQIYLLKDLKGQGKAGDIVNLNDGYAKNFVLKNKIGKVVDNAVLSDIKAKKDSENFKNQTEIAAIKELITKLKDTTVTIRTKIGANQKLFGSITNTEVAAALQQQGITIDKRHIEFNAPIKAAGTYNVNIKFNHNLSGQVTVIVEGING